MPRRRLLVSLVADDKYGLAFCAGGLLALRDLHLLEHTSVFLASGQAALLQAWLHELCSKAHAHFRWYDALSGSEATTVDPLRVLVERTLDWGRRNLEKEMMRCRACRPSRWLDPWIEALAERLEALYGVDAWWNTADSVSESVLRNGDLEAGTTTHRDSDPVFLYSFGLDSSLKAMYLSSEEEAQNMPTLRVLGHSAVRKFSRLLCACVSPLNRFTGLTVKVRAGSAKLYRDLDAQPSGTIEVPVEWVCHSGLASDALNTGAANLLYIRKKLGPLPNARNEEALEPDTSEKLVLIDGYTYGVLHGRNATGGHSALLGHIEARSAADRKHERLLALRSGIAHLWESADMAMPGHTDAYESFTRGLWLHQTRANASEARLTSATLEWLKQCVNVGYMRTYRAFCGSVQTYVPMPPLVGTSDPYGLRAYFFPQLARLLKQEQERAREQERKEEKGVVRLVAPVRVCADGGDPGQISLELVNLSEYSAKQKRRTKKTKKHRRHGKKEYSELELDGHEAH